jgi:dTDP-4-dehydrorhamnose reductase
VHIGCTREEQMRWLVEAWRGALRARAEGADVRAITAWALLGSFNWDSLVTRDAGHYEPGAFDVRGSTPRRTALANVIASLAAGCEPSHPALRGTPWWHRADRLIHGPSIDEPLPAASGAIRAGAPMILIVGDAGRSDDAIKHVCDTRGLAAHVGSHHEMEAMLSGLQPWAALISGRSDLADACHQRGIPVAIISSDGEIQDLAHAALDRLIDAPTVH